MKHELKMNTHGSEWKDRSSQQRKKNYKKNLMEILKFENTMSEKDLQITYLTKDLYLKYTKNSSHSAIRKQTAQ